MFKADDKPDYEFKEATLSENLETARSTLVWIASLIDKNSSSARRRLDAFLFAHRVFRKFAPADAAFAHRAS